LGPGFVKAIKGPCPWTSIMVTGGVGLGSKLISKEMLASENFDQLRSKVQNTAKIIERVKK